MYDETISPMGLNVWLSCFCESLHTKHTGCLSSRQKSLSFLLCKLQISSDSDECLSFLSFRSRSHKFFNTRLHRGPLFVHLLLQTGHSWVSLILQNCWRHSLQALCPHDKTSGSLKISLHTGQEKSASEIESIFTVWAPAIQTLTFTFWMMLQKLVTTKITKNCWLFRNRHLYSSSLLCFSSFSADHQGRF